MTRKRVLITLPLDAYQRLAKLADEEERVIDQQASLLLKRLLVGATVPASDVFAKRVDAEHDANGHTPAETPAGVLS